MIACNKVGRPARPLPQEKDDTIGQRLDRVRRDKGLTQRQLASTLGMTSGNLCDLLYDKHSPTFKTLQRLAKALDVHLSELVKGLD